MARGQNIELAKVFYTLEMRGQAQIERQIDQVGQKFSAFASFLRANPVAAIGALAAAAGAAGLKLAEMARESDLAVRKIAAVIPGGVSQLERIRDAINQVAGSTGRSQEELLALAAQVARQGVSGSEEFLLRLQTISRAADATGGDLQALAVGLDNVLDIFQLSSDQLESVAAKLKAAGAGKFPIEDILDSFQKAAPLLAQGGVSFDLAAQALGKFVAQGLNVKQAGTALADLVKNGGAEAVRLVAGNAIDAATALKEFNASADLVAASSERLSGQLREKFGERLRQIGQAINDGILDPMRQLALLLTDPVFTKFGSGQGQLESSIFTVLSGPVRAAQEAAKAAANRGGPVLLPDLNVQVDSPETAQRKAEAAREQARSFIEGVQADLAKLTPALSDDLALVIDRFREAFHKAAGSMDADQRAIAEQRLAQLQHQLDLIKKAEGEKLTPQLSPFTPGPIPIRELTKEDVKDAQKSVEENAKKLEEIERNRLDSLKEQKRALIDQSVLIERAARGGIELANGLGLIDDAAAKAAESVASIAANIGLAASGNLSGILAVLGGLSSLISGLFGPSKEDLERLRIERANQQSLNDLLSRIGDLGLLDVTGRAADLGRRGTQALIDAGLAGVGAGGVPPGRRSVQRLDRQAVEQILAPLGESLADLEATAKRFRIEINTANADVFLASIKKLNAAIAASELAQFAGTFEGQLQALQLEFDLFDITDPIEQLKKLRELAVSDLGSPLLKQKLAGLDLSTAAGRAAADAAIKELGLQLKTGGITPEQLGGLTGAQFEDLLKQLHQLIGQSDQAAGTSTGGAQQGFSVDRSLTEATGGVLRGLLTDLVLTAREMRDLLAQLVGVLVPVGAPALPGGAVAAAGVAIQIAIAVNVTGPVDAATAPAVGQQIGTAAAEAIDQQLQARLRSKSAAVGNNLVQG